MLYPYKFTPALIERVWGGNALEHYGKSVPPGKHIGESWEISDRDDVQSVVANGHDKGKTLRQQIETHGIQLLGTNCVADVGRARSPNAPNPADSASSKTPAPSVAPTALPRFPLLVKLLDARERLSLQVHPPPALAAKLKGEPKTEMWYVLETDPDAHLIAGLRKGVSGADFMRALEGQKDVKPIEDMLYRFPVMPGDVFFVPSGRIHAIDAGVVLVEIQQNSDTTYRVYDWGRVGLDGKPRQLHVKESLVCIDFKDFEPKKQRAMVEQKGVNGLWRLVECEYFHVHRLDLTNAWPDRTDGSTFHILTCISGQLGILTPDGKEDRLNIGEFLLIPASLGFYTLTPLAENTRALKSYVPGPK
ncbi:MAG TPA: class I mannose-6-phosphate isomerase [Verrucomicrobiae bacterium]|nr:class I mannose-6-phosphate isomerase [Verrucomicrobiae bacterium]